MPNEVALAYAGETLKWEEGNPVVSTSYALTAAIREGQGKIFSEDLGMLESQQRNLLARPERELLSLNIDAGGRHSRRPPPRQRACGGRPA